eukprot:SAG25_NODE_3674_length_1003_cov_1.407080_1_plen_76_part_00
MNAVRPCCVVEPSPGDPLVTATCRVHGALSAVPIYLGTLVNTLLLCYVSYTIVAYQGSLPVEFALAIPSQLSQPE